MLKLPTLLYCLSTILTSAAQLGAGPAHLLISEVLIDAPGSSSTENNITSAEFIEIYNPTQFPISLANYVLTDYPAYHTLPGGSFVYGNNSSDYMLRFPGTASLGSGQAAVVTLDAATFFSEVGSGFGGTRMGFLSQAGAPQLFEIKDSDAAIPEMINLKAGTSDIFTFQKTNPGEFVALIYWDGQSDLVSDVDLIRWGSIVASEQLGNKSGALVDGPDAGVVTSAYKTDLLTDDFNFPIVPHAMVRHTVEEIFEIEADSNGITGHDETSENLKASFTGVTNSNVTPGLPHPNLPVASIKNWFLY